MSQMTPRMTIQEMIKAAAAGTASHAAITDEAIRQLSGTNHEIQEKTASADPDLPCETVSTAYAEKLAAAVEYVVLVEKKADAPPAGVTIPDPASATSQGPGEGPGALQVMQASSTEALPDAGQSGQAAKSEHIPPKDPALQTEKVQEGKANTGLETNDEMKHPEQPTDPMGGKSASAMELLKKHGGITVGLVRDFDKTAKYIGGRLSSLLNKFPGSKPAIDAAYKQGLKDSLSGAGFGGVAGGVAGGAIGYAAGKSSGSKKEGSIDPRLVDWFLSQTKQAEDAINPAQISSPATITDQTAPPPGASESGKDVPSEPSDVTSQKSMISSNQAAIDYTRREAKADPKSDVNKVLTEPALSSSTDKTLNQVLDQGVETAKISEATKVAAARALLVKLAEDAEKKAKVAAKEKDSQGVFTAPPTGGTVKDPTGGATTAFTAPPAGGAARSPSGL